MNAVASLFGAGEQIRRFAAAVGQCASESEARVAYRTHFRNLRTELNLYPPAHAAPSRVFASTAHVLRATAADCLPLGVALTMHLYPVCALQCVPITPLSLAWFRRALLMRTIRNRSLIVANTGSERSEGQRPALSATRSGEGIVIDGTCEYMSLASVADLVLLKVPLADSDFTVLCAAPLKGPGVSIGSWRFDGSMRLSDTASVTFNAHRLSPHQCVVVPSDEIFHCVADYQRSWFHLFLAEAHLARLEWLQQRWGLERSTEWVVHVNEMSHLREYALRLLDEFGKRRETQRLTSTTAAIKLRASLLARETAAQLKALESTRPADVDQLRVHADELRYIRWQPTQDDKVVRSLCR